MTEQQFKEDLSIPVSLGTVDVDEGPGGQVNPTAKERLDEDDVDINTQTENKATEETFGVFRETDKVTDSETHKGTSVPNVLVMTFPFTK